MKVRNLLDRTIDSSCLIQTWEGEPVDQKVISAGVGIIKRFNSNPSHPQNRIPVATE